MTTEQILDSYESLTSDMMKAVSALNIVRRWLENVKKSDEGYYDFIAFKEAYADIINLAMNDLQRLASEHYKFIERAEKDEFSEAE
ncbi:hypothetical protein [Streptococcus himalayensis]|uniref:Uncharacterized protein n=1 Tax=Streptococcus himalayensis TaxID=1888195 RepID=A0A917A9L4_9STRE|nr:hypothetical protein [Streptococcus himalayensis]QBX08378.1 hypothetical protein JavanS256_0006 [Streptococcus satellite phage Javan256]GGE36875.1 hypothetical protein GCM10011510_17800 [Streptococcus himalayensis]